MAEDLQGLLERIQRDGYQQAEAEKSRILAEAEKEAAKILKDAQTRADQLLNDARNESAQLKDRMEKALQQAARDVILALSASVESRLKAILIDSADSAMTPELMASLVKTLAEKFDPEGSGDLKVLAAPGDLEKLESALKSALCNSFKAAPELFPDRTIGGGLKVSFNGQDLYFDFSDDALTELVCDYIGPRLATVLKNAGTSEGL